MVIPESVTAMKGTFAPGAEYLCLVGSPELDDYFCVSGFPTSFFVDSEGHLLFEPIVGAYVDAYPLAVAEALNMLG